MGEAGKSQKNNNKIKTNKIDKSTFSHGRISSLKNILKKATEMHKNVFSEAWGVLTVASYDGRSTVHVHMVVKTDRGCYSHSRDIYIYIF